MMPYRLVEGWTDPIDYQLKRSITGGVPIPFNGTGMTVSLVASDRNGGVLALTGSVAWLDATVSTVRFTPATTDLQARYSPILVRFKVVNGASVAYFPPGDPEEWAIADSPK